MKWTIFAFSLHLMGINIIIKFGVLKKSFWAFLSYIFWHFRYIFCHFGLQKYDIFWSEKLHIFIDSRYESEDPGFHRGLNNHENQSNFRSQQINRRFQSLTTEETDEDLDSEADENVQLLPKTSSKMWQETETNMHAETSPDSLADVRFSDYSKVNGTHLNQSWFMDRNNEVF